MGTIGSVVRYRGGDRDEPLIIDDDPPPALTEAYKFLQTNLQFAALGTTGVKSILITSSNPGEGKTTTAINLATSIAREGASSVLLIDADLRRPNLHRLFHLDDHKGLTHLLLGTATLDEVASPTGIDGLRVIPAGIVPPDPPKLLRSERMREVVAELEESADLVFFDSPPLLAVTDPMIVASLVDGVLLIVESGRSRRDPVKLAVRMLERANPQFISTVLNKVTPRAESEYGYGYYAYREDDDNRNGAGRGLIPRALVKLRIRKPKPNGTRDGAREKRRATS
jgi:capsular exopolysaccharide synthesis family protein